MTMIEWWGDLQPAAQAGFFGLAATAASFGIAGVIVWRFKL